MKSESFLTCIDSNTTDMFKAQKGSKDIVKMSKSISEEKKMLNKFIIFVFFVQKVFS